LFFEPEVISRRDAMPYRAVLFDLDGTLLDTLEDLADAANAMLREAGYPEHPVEAYRYFVGEGVSTLIRRAVPDSARAPEVLAECERVYRANYARTWNVKTRPYDGVPEMLDALAERGLEPAVLSNKPDDATRRCVAEFLDRWEWAVVRGHRDGVPHKPDPAAALEIARRLDLPPSDVLYLGDTGIDMRTAVAAGMFPVGALWGFREAEELTEHGARALIEEPPRLVDLVRRA
jgi:phosphoglycolate phosphatase